MAPSLRKTQWPVHITDALGIPPIMGKGGPWHSTGDTTDLAWFHAMCDYLGIKYPGERIRAMEDIITAAGGVWNEARHSSKGVGKKPGGNVRREAFEDLWDCLTGPGGVAEGGTAQPGGDQLSRSEDQPPAGPVWAYRNIRLRQGQPAFRNRLLQAYGERCAISGDDIVAALDACHIDPHAAGGAMTTANGVLLRSDIHTLFDLGLIAVDTAKWSVVVHDSIVSATAGKSLLGAQFRQPQAAADRPSRQALDRHRARCGL